MTTSVQRRRGSTVQHTAFTGLEGEITVDTTKDTAVIHDGSTVGGFPLAKESLVNTNTTALTAIIGTDTASDDTFLIYDASAGVMKKITRAELNNAIEVDALANVTITGGSINGTTVGASTASTGAFTTLSASSTVSGSGFSTYLASPPAIGGSAPAAISSTNLAYTGTLTGGTGVVNLGSGQFYKDASGKIGLGTASPSEKLDVNGSIKTNSGVLIGGTSTYLYEGSANSFNIRVGADGPYAEFVDASGVLEFGNVGGALALTSTGTERMRIDTSGNVGIGTNSPTKQLSIGASGLATLGFTWTGDGASKAGIEANHTTGEVRYVAFTNYFPTFYSNNTERMRIDSSGNLLLGGTSTPGAKVMYIANATTVPASNPTGGGVLYVEGGALKYRGSSGTVTTIANA